MLPAEDLAHISHETNVGRAEFHDLLVSTPRSGSTWICASIDPLLGYPMAEYCQPHQIIPHIASNRPDLVVDEKLSFPKYAMYLSQSRTGESKGIGINVHASHLAIYRELRPYLPPLRRLVMVLRQDLVAQAVSYYLASKTGKWSSHYVGVGSGSEIAFDYDEIRGLALKLIAQVRLNLEAFPTCDRYVLYEAITAQVASPAELFQMPASTGAARSTTKKQAGAVNKRFAELFIENSLAVSDFRIANEIDSYKKKITAITQG